MATDGYITLVQPAIIEYYGQSQARAVDDPLSVITSMNKHGLVKATLVEYYGRSGGADIDEPLPTVTAKARHGLADPVLIEVNDENEALVQPILVQTSQTGGKRQLRPAHGGTGPNVDHEGRHVPGHPHRQAVHRPQLRRTQGTGTPGSMTWTNPSPPSPAGVPAPSSLPR